MRLFTFDSGFRCCLVIAFTAGFVVEFAELCRADITFVEDFQDDLDPTMGGFDSTVFMHNVVGPNSNIEIPQNVVPPSPAHAFFMGAMTTDLITFNLMPGKSVDSASLWMTGTGGGAAAVTFIGTNGDLTFSIAGPDDLFQQFSVTLADGLGEITMILLGDVPPGGPSQEAYYDDIAIHVIPEPSAFGLASLAVLGAQLRRRKQLSKNSLSQETAAFAASGIRPRQPAQLTDCYRVAFNFQQA